MDFSFGFYCQKPIKLGGIAFIETHDFHIFSIVSQAHFTAFHDLNMNFPVSAHDSIRVGIRSVKAALSGVLNRSTQPFERHNYLDSLRTRSHVRICKHISTFREASTLRYTTLNCITLPCFKKAFLLPVPGKDRDLL